MTFDIDICHDIWHLTFDIDLPWHLTFDIDMPWHLTFDMSWHLTFTFTSICHDIRHSTFNIQHLTYDIQHLTSDIWHLTWYSAMILTQSQFIFTNGFWGYLSNLIWPRESQRVPTTSPKDISQIWWEQMNVGCVCKFFNFESFWNVCPSLSFPIISLAMWQLVLYN